MIAEVRDAWSNWLMETGDWHIFGTLTYRQGEADKRPHPEAVEKHVMRWLGQAPKVAGHRVEAAVVGLEFHKSGWPHAHALLRMADKRWDRDFAQLGQAWYERHGYAKLEVPRSVDQVAAYVTKYVVKDMTHGGIVIWPRRGSFTDHQPGLVR